MTMLAELSVVNREVILFLYNTRYTGIFSHFFLYIAPCGGGGGIYVCGGTFSVLRPCHKLFKTCCMADSLRFGSNICVYTLAYRLLFSKPA